MKLDFVLMNERLEEAFRQLQSEQMAALGRLAGGVAHEINNPLAYISSNVGMLKNDLDSLFRLLAASQARYAADECPRTPGTIRDFERQTDPNFLCKDLQSLIAEVQEGVNRVELIVRELRLFAHSGEGDWQQADLHDALDSAIKFAGSAMKPGIAVEKTYGTIGKVECIPGHINQVFLNLIVNGLQAMGDKGKLCIATGQQDQEVRIAITDTGTGISEEYLNRIFEPFYTGRPFAQGRGLGLSLSYSIVRTHQGRITVESKPQEGSTFTVCLPVRQSLASAA